MRILITNDDGIMAPGLLLAEEIAAELAGPDGEVWVVAPDFERSGVSHAISYTSPMRMTQLGPRRFSVDGFAEGTFSWTGITTSAGRVRITVGSAGVHVLNLWMREDGATVDRLILTTDASYTPSGNGPPASPRG